MPTPEVRIFETIEQLVIESASQIADYLTALLQDQESVHFAITGGTIGTKVLGELARITTGVNLLGLHIWWTDERFVSSDSSDRNELSAREAWLDASGIPESNLHPFPSSDSLALSDAAMLFAEEVERVNPSFDLIVAGLGEDGHVASLFPYRTGEAVGSWVVYESQSPKPPSERLSLSLRAICSSKKVWFLVSGIAKAEAVREALSLQGSSPAAKISGTEGTSWFIDSQAAKLLTSF